MVSALALSLGVVLGRRQSIVQVASGRLSVTVVNVGQGEASWIRTPNGRFVVIGGGPPHEGRDVVASLKEAGATQIDLLVLPYPYTEAMGGVGEIVQAFPVGRTVEAGGPVVNRVQAQTRVLLREKNIPLHMGRAGDSWTLDGVKVELLAPPEPILKSPPVALNNSLVVRATWGDTRFLWAGGLERAGEVALLGRMPNIKAQWLRVARSGSANASCAEFLRQVAPDFAVVSVGENREGLPHPSTVARLRASGARVYRTDTQPGALRFYSDGARVYAPE
jgi:beta-lactamase superfamily II metal-dependent hydrolase